MKDEETAENETVKAEEKTSSFILPPSSLLFVAGDVSGDIHSAMLAHKVLCRHPDWKIFAVGGPHLKRAGARLIGDSSGCGVIGIASALMILPRVLQLRARLLRFLKSHRIDAVVLCDWGAFNGRSLPELQARKIPVLYYFPPRSWAREGESGLSIAPLVSRVATPFEWSAKRLQERDCRAEWVGHPLLEIVSKSASRDFLRSEFGVRPDQKLIALLPGSRALEWKYIAPHLAGAARLLRERIPNLRFIVALPLKARERVAKYFVSETKDLQFVEGRAADVLRACDAAVVKSGTSTLEAAVCDAPQIVVYDGPAILRAQWKLGGGTRKTPFVAMPNIIAGRAIVPELLGSDCRAENIAAHVGELLTDEARRAQMRRDYDVVRVALGAQLPQSATERTAQILEEMISIEL